MRVYKAELEATYGEGLIIIAASTKKEAEQILDKEMLKPRYHGFHSNLQLMKNLAAIGKAGVLAAVSHHS